jgi:four helix bundle protein
VIKPGISTKTQQRNPVPLIRPEIAQSPMGNTAEGFHRNSNKDFMRFLGYSRSSIAETVSHSYVAYDQEYIDEQELEEVKRLADIAWKKINNFISYLNKTKKRTN